MRYSDIFNIPNKVFIEKGVFNASVDEDSKLHIDPSLFKHCRIPEFQGAYDEFRNHFVRVFNLVPLAKQNKRAYDALVRSLMFREIANTGLGYSINGTRGNGIGQKLAKKIAQSVIEIYDLGITNPVVFEMLPFFEDGVGADRISDMTSVLLIERLLQYTKRICDEIGIATRPAIRHKGVLYEVPCYKSQSIVLVPTEVLCDLPMAYEWDDIDRVSSYNSAFRLRISQEIGERLTDVNRMPKREIKRFLMSHPDIFNEFIYDWEQKSHSPYDIKVDKKGVMARIKQIFISYSWEDREHEQWVQLLAKDLSVYFDVRIDNKLPLGADLNVFMEQSINNSDYVLLILTPEYKHRADNRINGVGYETNVITNDMIRDNNKVRFIPLIRKGDKDSSFPIYLGNKKGLNMTIDAEYQENLQELVKNLI